MSESYFNRYVSFIATSLMIAVIAPLIVAMPICRATTIMEVSSKCYVCGKTLKYKTWMSTNQFGSPDLDTRAPEMARSTMFMWVKCCPSCGYCASDVSEGPLGVSELEKLIRSEE